jgi:hypothetical protein
VTTNGHIHWQFALLSWLKRTPRFLWERQLLKSYSEVALAWMRPANLVVPTAIFDDYEDHGRSEECEWRPYPQAGPRMVIPANAIDAERYQLYTIAADLLPLVLNANPADSPLPGHPVLNQGSKRERLHEIELQFLEWLNRLPTHIKQVEGSALPLAGPVLDL